MSKVKTNDCPKVQQLDKLPLLHTSPYCQQLGYIGAVNMVVEANRNANSHLYSQGLAYQTH